jgi:CBS domain-containing protein
MTPNPIALSITDPVKRAAIAMRDAGVGAIVVTKGGRLHGIVTDRDIVVRCVADDADCGQVPLAEVCSEEITSVEPNQPVEDAVKIMRERAVRRLPVVEDGRPVGIVSIGDLALARDPDSALAGISEAPPNR